jgi:oxygen-independent coproporphyrinogen-3 oxidase
MNKYLVKNMKQTLKQKDMNRNNKMGMYIHIPFCIRKCNYCDFLSFDDKEYKINQYIDVLLEEIKNHSYIVDNKSIKSIFIGGGTPSILTCEQIEKIMNQVNKYYVINNNAEISIECNPGTITKEKANAYINNSINRISLGLQSTNDNHLKALGRIHAYNDFEQNYYMLKEVGFNNINVDLMFGLPNQTINQWEQSLQKIIDLEPKHISMYGLIIEEGTDFYNKYKNRQLIIPEESIEREMYWLANSILEESGYNHYEISNYSKESYECKHNKIYWTMEDYLGCGLGAASFINGERKSNIRDLNEYILTNGEIDKIVCESKKISENNTIEEFMFLGLRLINGISKAEFERKFSYPIEKIYSNVLHSLEENKLIYDTNDRIKLTNKGIDVSNYVFAQFLL